ncbi:hypothetical protein ES707_20549 [subsurface metagenome]
MVSGCKGTMKKTLNKSIRNEQGQALIFALIMLAVGSLIVVPLLAFMSTGLMAAQTVEEKMNKLYAADAGVEDAAHKILTNYGPFASLGVNDSYTYSLTDSVNGEDVSVTATKLSLIANFIGDDEYKVGQPHEDWVTFDSPIVSDQTEDYVEYSCDMNFHYTGGGNRRIETVGAFLTPFPGSVDLIVGPYEVVYTPLMTSDFLEAGSPETVLGSGSFAFIWRWQKNEGPIFLSDDTGSLSFKFRVLNPSWEYSLFFIWATFKEQDISYVTNAPGSYNWQIEAVAGDTTVRSFILGGGGQVGILTWEVNP